MNRDTFLPFLCIPSCSNNHVLDWEKKDKIYLCMLILEDDDDDEKADDDHRGLCVQMRL